MAFGINPAGNGGKLHLAAYTLDSITIGVSAASPTYLTGVLIFPTSSPQFEVIDVATGLIKNNSNRPLTMQGTASYQLNNGTGGTAQLNLWSERSADDGVTFEVNTLSLRNSEASNTSESSQTKASAVSLWLPGESVRFAMYNSAGGTLTFAAPTDTVNGSEVVSGFSFYWQLNEV